MARQNRFTYARQALDKMGGREGDAINLIVAWYKSDSEVRLAFLPEEKIVRSLARQAIQAWQSPAWHRANGTRPALSRAAADQTSCRSRPR